MDYGIFIEGVFNLAPRKIVIGDAAIYNPTGEQLLSVGYKPLTYTEKPEEPEGYEYRARWEDSDNSIIQIWDLYEKEPEEIDDSKDYETAGRILMGKE